MENLEDPQIASTQPQAPIGKNGSGSIGESKREELELKSKEIELKDRENQLKQKEIELKDKEIELKDRENQLKQKEIELDYLKQQHEDAREKAKIDREIRLRRENHWLRCDASQRRTKATVGILSMVGGLYFHIAGDSIGRYLLGGGAAFFGVSMANITITTSKDEKELSKVEQ